jgi:hypothetical protein
MADGQARAVLLRFAQARDEGETTVCLTQILCAGAVGRPPRPTSPKFHPPDESRQDGLKQARRMGKTPITRAWRDHAAFRLAVRRQVNAEDVPAAISRAFKQPATWRADPPNGQRADLQVETVSGAAA